MKRAGEADELLDAEGEAGDGSVAVALELDELDDALDRLAVLDLLATDAGQKQHLGERIGADARVPPGQEIVQHRHGRADTRRQKHLDRLTQNLTCAARTRFVFQGVTHLDGGSRPLETR
jgi:hypothetical protein